MLLNEALFCLTDSTDCCNSRGAWRLPNGDNARKSFGSPDFFIRRGNGTLRLNRRRGITTGIFMCVVPTANSSAALPLYIGVYGSADEGESLD